MDGIIDNLRNAIETWNEKLAEIWILLTQSPEEFKGGSIWTVIEKIHGALLAIGIALLVLFFVVAIVKTCTSFQEIKRPEQAIKLFIRFVIARGIVVYGMELMKAVFTRSGNHFYDHDHDRDRCRNEYDDTSGNH